MGNQLLKKYLIDKDSVFSGGYNNYWKIYRGSHKERKKEVSVFVFEKKKIEKLKKYQKEEVINILKKECQMLIKFKHPNILGVVEPICEDKESMVFVTDPLGYSLSSWFETVKPSKLEIKTLLTELFQTVSFLHDEKVIHLSLCPENIFIDPSAHVKLSGFNFSITDPQKHINELKLYNFNTAVLPNLKFIAPEIVFENKVGYFSDLFSLGALIFHTLKLYKGESQDMINLHGQNGSNSIDLYKKEYIIFKEKLEKETLLDSPDDNEILNKCLEHVYEGRPTIKEILELVWFNDPKLKGLKFIEGLEGNDANKNIEFLNNFPNIMNSFEDKIIEKRILPCFMQALKIEHLVPHLLPPIFAICEERMKNNFEGEIWVAIKRLFHMKHINAQALYFILKKIPFISDKISNLEFTQHMASILCKALDSGVGKIQIAVLDNLSHIIRKVDSMVFKTKFFPRLTQIILNTTSSSIKYSILNAFKNVFHLLDQNLINDNILAALEKVRKSDNSNDICMAVVAVYEEIFKVVSLESIANKVLPNLISIMVSGNISKSNFDIIMSLVQKYLARIKETREKELIAEGNNNIVEEVIHNPSKGTPSNKEQMDFLNNFFVEKKIENGKEFHAETPKNMNKPTVEIPNQQIATKTSPENQTLNIGSNGQPLELVKSDIKIQHNKSKSFNFPNENQTNPSNKATVDPKELDKMFNEFVFENPKSSNADLKSTNFNNGFNEDFFNFNNKFEPFSNNLLFNQPVQFPKTTYQSEKGFDLNAVVGNSNQINFNEFNFVEDNFSKKGKMW